MRGENVWRSHLSMIDRSLSWCGIVIYTAYIPCSLGSLEKRFFFLLKSIFFPKKDRIFEIEERFFTFNRKSFRNIDDAIDWVEFTLSTSK